MKGRLLMTLAALSALLLLGACGSLGSYHRVAQGETLYSISWHYGQDYRKVAAWNHIPKPYVIHQGERLRISPLAATSPARQLVRKSLAHTKPASRLAAVHQAPGPLQRREDKLRGRRKIAWNWPAQGIVIRKFSTAGSKGIDIAGKKGAPVRAAAGGRVVYSGSGLPYYGKLVIIKHNDKYLSAYAHNSRILVKEGALINGGQQIAVLGRSGTAVPRLMLHFEIRADGAPVDPLHYLPAGKTQGK